MSKIEILDNGEMWTVAPREELERGNGVGKETGGNAGNTIYAFYGQEAPGLDDPSNLKTAFGGEDHVFTGSNEQGTLNVLAVGTHKELLPVCPKGVVKIVLTD